MILYIDYSTYQPDATPSLIVNDIHKLPILDNPTQPDRHPFADTL